MFLTMITYGRASVSVIPISVLCCMMGGCYSLTTTEMTTLYSTIFTNYDPRLPPLINQSSTAEVGLVFYIFNINSFDEISGVISLSKTLVLQWTEERISWNPADYEGKTSLRVRPWEIWHPEIFLLETADSVEDLTNTSIQPRIQYNGQVTWTIGNVIRFICSVDVTFFPFDTQKCDVTFFAGSYLPSELNLFTTDSRVNSVNTFAPNSQWKLLATSSVSNASDEDTLTGVQVTLHLQRLVTFAVVYIIVPTVFLSILNILVFVMPKDSGERLSVSTTLFLSFIVYMGVVNDNVPESSEPMSFFYYYLLFQVIYSSCIMFLCVVSLRIHGKKTQVPSRLQLLVRWLDRDRSFKRTFSESTVRPDSPDPIKRDHIRHSVGDLNKDNMKIEQEEERLSTKGDLSNSEIPVEWDRVGEWFDFCCLMFLGLANLAVTSVSFDRIINKRY